MRKQVFQSDKGDFHKAYVDIATRMITMQQIPVKRKSNTISGSRSRIPGRNTPLLSNFFIKNNDLFTGASHPKYQQTMNGRKVVMEKETWEKVSM